MLDAAPLAIQPKNLPGDTHMSFTKRAFSRQLSVWLRLVTRLATQTTVFQIKNST